MLTATIEESMTREGRLAAKRLMEHLGEEYFYHLSDGKDYGDLRRRGPRPIPAFDWSSVPVYKEEDESEEEGVSAESFVGQTTGLAEALKSRMGSWGVAMDYSVESLSGLDEWLVMMWTEDSSPGLWESRELNDELAAYIGEVVRKISGGEWRVEVFDGQSEPVVRYGDATRQCFRPLRIVDEVVVKGLPAMDESEVGIYEVGFSATVWVWMTSHLPQEVLKRLSR